jgi:hypothetical protein
MLAAVPWMCGSMPVAAQSLDGAWRSEGYGLYFDVSGSTLNAYELTAVSCLPSFTAERTSGSATSDTTFRVVGQAGTYTLRADRSPDRRFMHRNGAASDIVIRRLGAAPSQCARPIANTPQNNFDVVVRTWAEQYGFFDLRKADWRAITARYRPKVSDRCAHQQWWVGRVGTGHRIAADGVPLYRVREASTLGSGESPAVDGAVAERGAALVPSILPRTRHRADRDPQRQCR